MSCEQLAVENVRVEWQDESYEDGDGVASVLDGNSLRKPRTLLAKRSKASGDTTAHLPSKARNLAHARTSSSESLTY